MNNSFKKRIDELGRIVIPKEIRKNYKIKDWDELLLVCNDEGILIKRTDDLLTYINFFDSLFDLLKEFISYKFYVIINNKVISSSDKEIGLINERFKYDLKVKSENIVNNLLVIENVITCKIMFIEPIIVDSNYYGTIIMLSDKLDSNEKKILKKLVNIVNDILI